MAQAVGIIQPVKKHRCFIINAVLIGVFKKDNSASAPALQSFSDKGAASHSIFTGVIPHFNNPKFPIRAPFEGNRTFNQWLTRNDLDFETGWNTDAIQGFQGRFWRRLILRRISPTRGTSEERQSNQTHATHISFSENSS